MRTAITLLTLSLLACDPTASSTTDESAAKSAPAKPDAKADSPEPPEPPEDGAKTPPSTSEPAPEPAPEPTATKVETLSVDASHSKVDFAVSRAPIGHLGHFESFEATLRLEAGHPSDLQIRVATSSVVADRRGLTEHLKSEDFLDVTKYPSATFEAKSLTPNPDAGPDGIDNVDVAGVMRLHGVDDELEFPARFDIDDQRVIARATLDVSAKAFGIDYEGMEDELAEDAVALEVELWFPRVAPE